ncbi:MAG: DNA cytosine methyltransferase, partial [Tenuifilum sp.]
QAGEHIDTVWKGIIQFRPSGIRVKRPTEFPALVAMVHIPVVGWEKRRLTPREVANLQSFPENYIINSNAQQAYKQFGNAVNVKVVEFLAKQLFMQA